MSKLADIDIERQEILKEAAELGYSPKGGNLYVLKEILEDCAGSWNGEDDECMGTGYFGGDTVTEEDAMSAKELLERLEALIGTGLFPKTV